MHVVTLRIERGDWLLLEGSSGSGKSTLAVLLAGLRRPESGLLLAGGLDRATLGAAGWRKRVAAAPQLDALGLAGNAYRQAGRYSEAEPLLRSALDHSERAFGSSHPAVSGALNNLAVLYKYTGQFDEAERLYERALAILEQAFGVDSLETATIHHNLGGLEHARGRYANGEPHARRAYEIRRRFLGDDHPQTAADAAAWAGVLDGLGRFDESEPLYRHALAVFERTSRSI